MFDAADLKVRGGETQSVDVPQRNETRAAADTS